MPYECDCCYKDNAKKKCTCGCVYYCNEKCQKEHWVVKHKFEHYKLLGDKNISTFEGTFFNSKEQTIISISQKGVGVIYEEGKYIREVPSGDWEGEIVYKEGTYRGRLLGMKYNGRGSYVFNKVEPKTEEEEKKELNNHENGICSCRRKFKGKFDNGVIKGDGLLYMGSGTIIEGKLKGHSIYGKGKIKYIDGSKYKGNFVESKLYGLGKIKMSNGTRVKGWFTNDVLDGMGKIKFPSGVYMKGKFSRGKLNGRGVRIEENGQMVECNWLNGMPLGKARMVFPSGRVVEGTYSGKDDFMNGGYILRIGREFKVKDFEMEKKRILNKKFD